MEGQITFGAVNGYTEACVKRKNTPLIKAEKLALIIADVLIFLLGLGSASTLLAILGIAGAIALYMFIPRFNIAWDCIYCDGQFDFDKIINGDGRKHVYRVDLEYAEAMAPEAQLASYAKRPDVRVRDFTSKDPSARRYAIYAERGQDRSLIIFEPSDRMIELAAQKAPRKVTK